MIENRALLRLLLPALVTGVLLACAGCDKQPEPIPAGSFRAVVEDVVENELVRVRRITITAPGRRGVSLSEKGGLDQIWADPDPQTGLMTVQVVVVADLIKFQPTSENLLRWMVRMTSGGSTVGGPGVQPAGSAQSLGEILSFRLDSGVYSLSRDITLGYLRDRELILRVQ
jgi:hypothetical protein